MNHLSFKGKQIIWQSRASQVWLVIGCFIFVAAAIFVHQQISVLVFWTTMLLFGGGGFATLRQLLNSNLIFVKPGSSLAKQIGEEQERIRQADLGAFAYDDTGFTYTQLSGTIHCQWAEIESLFGYQVTYFDDRSYAEEVHLDIFARRHLPITLTQFTPGWRPFLNRLSEHIPTVSRDWTQKIAVSISRNLTLLFDRAGRTQEQVELACYPEKNDQLPP